MLASCVFVVVWSFAGWLVGWLLGCLFACLVAWWLGCLVGWLPCDVAWVVVYMCACSAVCALTCFAGLRFYCSVMCVCACVCSRASFVESALRVPRRKPG